MTKVVNLKNEVCDIRICRPSIWGNPYKIDAFTTRDKAIWLYKQWLLGDSPRAKELRSQLHTLRDKRLGCWCQPLPCHGDVLVDLIKETYNED